MNRRSFFSSAFSTLAAASLTSTQLVAAAARARETAAIDTTGRQVALKPSEINELRASLRGRLLAPSQEGYDSARKVWNGAFDRRPALIARCAGTADVRNAVAFCRAHELLVAVHSGGHSFPGHSVCDGGLMIDLSVMKGIRVDPRARIARIQPGVLLREIDHETQAFGLATPLGTVSGTGASGLTLGGGFGRLARRFGLACDNLIGADVLTANGDLVVASERENADLLWGLRGGGGNLGIATSLEYRLHEVTPTMMGGTLVFPFTQPRALLRAFADFIAGASDEFFVMVDIVPTPSGRIVALDVCHSGSRSAAESECGRLRAIGRPVQDTLRPARYVDLQKSIDKDYPAGRGYYLKSGFIQGISPRLIDALVDYLEAAPAPAGIASIIQHGGAISRVKPDATAYWNRAASHTVLLAGVWDAPSGAERSTQWVRTGWQTLQPLTDGFYDNLMAPDDPGRRVRGTYGGNYDRLASLKKRFDPANLFRLNANVEP